MTDDQGQYRIADLRPGTYEVTFSLAGFTSVTRTAIELSANFTAPVNVTMVVGALEESITVSAQSPLVDVQSTARRQVLDQRLLDALPTARDFQTVVTVPGVGMAPRTSAGRNRCCRGPFCLWGRGTEQAFEIDDQNMMSTLDKGQYPYIYQNQGEFQEMVTRSPADRPRRKRAA